MVQVRLSEASHNKEYVDMAIGILRDSSMKTDEDLRQWAVSVLDKTAPVPFSRDLSQRISAGSVEIEKYLAPKIPQQLLGEGLRWNPLEKEGATWGDLLENYVENKARFEMNQVDRDTLTELINIYDDRILIVDDPRFGARGFVDKSGSNKPMEPTPESTPASPGGGSGAAHR
jgi:hypothetical protein